MTHRLTPTARLPAIAFVAVAIIGALVAAPTVAVADQQQQARELFQEGRTYFDDGEYLQAAELFVEAYELLDAPELLFNIGQAYRRADELVKAEEYFERYLNKMADPPNEDEVVDTIVEIQQKLSAKQARVSVTTDPSRADLYVDDENEPRCQTPCELELLPGEYSLRAQRADHKPGHRPLSVDPGEALDVAITLEPDLPTGELLVETDADDAALTVGDQTLSLPHPEPVQVEAGSTPLAIEHGGDQIDYRVDVDADERVRLFVPLEQTTGGLSLLRTGAIGASTAALGVGTAALLTGLNTRSTHRQLQQTHRDVGAVDPGLVASGQRQQRIANGLWIGSALLAAAGIGLWTWDWLRSRDTGEPDVEPTDDGPGVDML